MRVGLFTDTYFPQVSGVATSIRTLKKNLKKKVMRFTFLQLQIKMSNALKIQPSFVCQVFPLFLLQTVVWSIVVSFLLIKLQSSIILTLFIRKRNLVLAYWEKWWAKP